MTSLRTDCSAHTVHLNMHEVCRHQRRNSLLSDVMLGQSLGIIPKESKIAPLECMVLSEPALVCDGKELSPNERDKKRAELIRNNI